MKKGKGFRLFNLSWFVLPIVMLLLVACNNDSKKKGDDKDTTTASRDTTAKSNIESSEMRYDSTFAVGEVSFSAEDYRSNKLGVLKMTKAQFIDAFEGKKKNRMIKFRFDKRNGQWTLFCFGANALGERTSLLEKIHLEVVSTDHYVEISKSDEKYDLLMSRGKVKRFFNAGGIGQDEPVDETKLGEVWLYPCRRASDGRIMFYLAPPNTTTFGCPKPTNPDGDLNPSPPDNACIQFGCDN